MEKQNEWQTGCNQMKACAIRALGQIEFSAQSSIWDAHRGCAVLAGALLIHERLVEEDVAASIRRRIESTLGSEETGPVSSAGVQRGDFIQRVVRELEIGAEVPKEIGHDVIYSGYVLRALDIFDIDPWESLLEGVIRLIRQVKSSGSGWITVNGRNEVREPDSPVESDGRDYWSIFCSFDRSLPMEVGDMQLGHLLTHGHAIDMMRAYATEALVRKLDFAYRKRLHLLAAANKDERSSIALRRKAVDPRSNAYWKSIDRFGDMHGHALKYAYSFLDLRRDDVTSSDLEAFGRIVWPAQPAAALK